jgi:hypothetical protein
MTDSPHTMKRLAQASPAVLLLALLVGCGGSASPAQETTSSPTHTTPTTPATFSAHGYIDVDGSSYRLYTGGRTCQPDDGYDDITPGAQVTVTSPSGEVIAVGRLGAGRRSAPYTCRFRFTVAGIPDGLPLYSVEVGHRGALTYNEAEMKQGLAFTLQ